MTCDTCGEQIEVSDWPFCPHGKGANTVVPDDIPGGQVFENGWAEPRKFYSRSEHRRALAAAGLEIRAKNAGPDDKICPRWDTVDLAGAEELVKRYYDRPRVTTGDPRWKDANIPISVRILDGEGVRRKDLV